MRIISICLFLAIMAHGMEASDSAQSRVNNLAAKVTNGDVVTIEIFQIPARVLTRARVTPGMLEKQYYYKLAIRDVRGAPMQGKLSGVLRSLTANSLTETPDIRWGIVFYNADGGRIGALYLDKSGSSGAVDNQAASFKGELFKWLDESFSGCFR